VPTYPPGQEGGERILLQRVRKLMDKASATANPHEADAFARKAAELVARHRIDPDRVTDVGDRDDLAVREVPLGRGAYVRARLALLMAVAATHDTRVVFGTTPTGTVAHVAGDVGDLDVVELMYHSLHAQAAARMASERRGTPAATQRYRRSFLFGYADRMGVLLADTRRETEAAVVAPTTELRRRRWPSSSGVDGSTSSRSSSSGACGLLVHPVRRRCTDGRRASRRPTVPMLDGRDCPAGERSVRVERWTSTGRRCTPRNSPRSMAPTSRRSSTLRGSWAGCES